MLYSLGEKERKKRNIAHREARCAPPTRTQQNILLREARCAPLPLTEQTSALRETGAQRGP
jgi:hypothetical protein